MTADIYALFDRNQRPSNPAQQPDTPARPAANGLHPYAAAAITAELGRLDALPRPWHPNSYWDQTTFEVACNLIELANSPWTGYTLDQARHDLHTHAPSDDQWGPREHAQKWDSGIDRVAGNGRPEPQPGDQYQPPPVTVINQAPVPDLDPDTEARFWNSRPLLQHIRDFARARMVAPWAVLGITLARALAHTPWTVHIPPIVGSRASLNFAVALVAPSGGGKGGADGASHDAIQMPHLPEYRIGSGEAIAHCLKHRQTQKSGGGTEWNTDNHNALINISEVDKLTAQAQRQGATIMPELRAAWSGEALGHVTADSTRRIPVEKNEYRLSLILGVQPGRAGGLLDDSDGGFPQRLVWLPAHDPDAPPLDQLPTCPEPITWHPPTPRTLISYHGTTIDVCPAAVEEVKKARWEANRGKGDPLDGHLLLARLKVAAGLAVLDNRYNINDEDWNLAGTVIAKSNATRANVVHELNTRKRQTVHAAGIAAAEREDAMADTLTEKAIRRLCPKILQRLDENEWTPRRVITHTWVNSRDKAHVNEALNHLLTTGQIVEDTNGKTYRYRLPGGPK